ncbi:MAG: amidinotransferase [Rhodospirillaceae bacterium]|nr:amidinotransferase [Rhodospirillaceae bacterium]
MPARILMCPPDHYEVAYAINPWMHPDDWRPHANDLAAESRREWLALRAVFEELGADIVLAEPAPGLPDMVFTANAAVVFDGVAVPARFRFSERQGEEPAFARTFAGLAGDGTLSAVAQLPAGLSQEGAGDCIWDRSRKLFWAGYGPRSDRRAVDALAGQFGQRVVPLELATEAFYHLDTCFCPLTGGDILFYPPAFTEAGQRTIAELAGDPERLIAAGPEDADRLGVNAVNLGRDIVAGACSEGLQARLTARGYRVHVVPLDAFRRSGGGAFCLTLRLDLDLRTVD